MDSSTSGPPVRTARDAYGGLQKPVPFEFPGQQQGMAGDDCDENKKMTEEYGSAVIQGDVCSSPQVMTALASPTELSSHEKKEGDQTFQESGLVQTEGPAADLLEVTDERDVVMDSRQQTAAVGSRVKAEGPSVADTDIDNLACVIEEASRAMSKAVVGRFLDVKHKLLLHQQQTLEAERQQAMLQLAAKQAQMEELRAAAAREARAAEVMRSAAGRAAALVARRGQQQRMHKWLQSFMWRWRVYAQEERRLKLLTRLADDFYRQKVLLRQALRRWRHFAFVHRRSSFQQQLQERVAEVETRTKDEASRAVSQLRIQLASAEEALTRMTEQHQALEERMRQAFMRGVCALNMEAVALLKSGGVGGGAPPPPKAASPTQALPMSMASLGRGSQAPTASVSGGAHGLFQRASGESCSTAAAAAGPLAGSAWRGEAAEPWPRDAPPPRPSSRLLGDQQGGAELPSAAAS